VTTDLDSQLHQEQFPPENRPCQSCQLVAYHDATYYRQLGCYTCSIKDESRLLKNQVNLG
jgi:hypothetical protein